MNCLKRLLVQHDRETELFLPSSQSEPNRLPDNVLVWSRMGKKCFTLLEKNFL